MKTASYKMIAIPPQAIIVGLGPVGTTLATLLKTMGWVIKGYDNRPKNEPGNQKSINFALSRRGLEALALLKGFKLPESEEMWGRAIHNPNGTISEDLYTPDKSSALLSIGRAPLSEALIRNAEESHVPMQFECGVTTVTIDPKTNNITALTLQDGTTIHVPPDTLVIATDGAVSTIRTAFLKHHKKEDLTQRHQMGYREYSIPSGKIPASLSPTFKNFHIWPQCHFQEGDFFAYGLPNADGSLNVNILGTDKVLKSLTAQDMHTLFETHFPDVAKLIDFEEQHHHPIGHFYSRKYDGINGGPNSILLGDALHPMFPFLGIGLNIGLEDVHKLWSELKEQETLGIDPTSQNGLQRIKSVMEKRTQDTDVAIDASAGNSKKIGESTEEERQIAKEENDIMLYLEGHSEHFKSDHTLYSFTTIPEHEIPWRLNYQERVVKQLQKEQFLSLPDTEKSARILKLDLAYKTALEEHLAK